MTKLKREKWSVYAEILRACKTPEIISVINRDCNLSHYIGMEHIKFLESKGLIEIISQHENRSSYNRTRENIVTRFATTEVGLKFIEPIDRIQQILA